MTTPWYWNFKREELEPRMGREAERRATSKAARKVNHNRLRESRFNGVVYFHCPVCGAGFVSPRAAEGHCHKPAIRHS